MYKHVVACSPRAMRRFSLWPHSVACEILPSGSTPCPARVDLVPSPLALTCALACPKDYKVLTITMLCSAPPFSAPSRLGKQPSFVRWLRVSGYQVVTLPWLRSSHPCPAPLEREGWLSPTPSPWYPLPPPLLHPSIHPRGVDSSAALPSSALHSPPLPTPPLPSLGTAISPGGTTLVCPRRAGLPAWLPTHPLQLGPVAADCAWFTGNPPFRPGPPRPAPARPGPPPSGSITPRRASRREATSKPRYMAR